MESEYPVVVEFGSLAWTGVGYLAHGAMLALQAGLALYLLRTAAGALRVPERRGFGFLRGVLGLLVLAPAALHAPWLVSLLGMTGALVLLLILERGVERGSPGRWLARSAAVAAVLTAAFAIWERDDPLALGARVVFKMSEWRAAELAWQLAGDLDAPKVGQLAPDFELADPSATRSTRLSSFRGKRAVALVFGSYT